MKEEYNRLFEKVAPRMSDEGLFRSVLNSGKEHSMSKNTSPKKSNRKALLITAVAAAAVAASTVGAAAVYNRSINDEYSALLAPQAEHFPQEYTDKDGNVSHQKDTAYESGLYEKLNIELNETIECEGFTLEIPGAISDGKGLIVMYNVFFDEDPGLLSGEKLALLADAQFDGVWGGGRLLTGVMNEYEGKKVYSSFFDLTHLERCTDDTLKISIMSLYGYGIVPPDGKKSYPINAEIEIPLTDELTRFNKTVDIPDEPYVKLANWGNYNITQLEAAPLGVTFSLKPEGEVPGYDVFKLHWFFEIPTYVTFKDGSSVDVSNGLADVEIDEENELIHATMEFNYPIDVDEIQSIQFVNALVDMGGNVTTVDAPEMPMWDDSGLTV